MTAVTEVDVLIIGPREFAAMAEIPGFRDALFKAMAQRLREVDAQLGEARRRSAPATPRVGAGPRIFAPLRSRTRTGFA